MRDGYDIVHLAGVAYVEDGESVVPLHDGYVRASELAALLIRNPPGLLYVDADWSGFVPVFGNERPLSQDGSDAFGDFYHRMQQRRPGLERVVARAGVGTFIGCMAPSRENVAREIAVAFYSHLLAGRPVAQSLFLARAPSQSETTEPHCSSRWPAILTSASQTQKQPFPNIRHALAERRGAGARTPDPDQSRGHHGFLSLLFPVIPVDNHRFTDNEEL